MTIDYTRLNQQIIKQAIGNLVLSEEMKQRLFEDKIKRAEAELKTRQLPARTERWVPSVTGTSVSKTEGSGSTPGGFARTMVKLV